MYPFGTPTRRDILKATAGLAFATTATAAAPHASIIDTHTHFYDPTRPEGVPWPGKDDAVLYRKVLPAEYKALAKPLGITGAVVVEASPRVEDNQWLLDLAGDEPFVLGVVGRLIPSDADFGKHLARFAKNPLFRGIRISSAELQHALKDAAERDRLKALGEAGLTLDVNGGPELLPVVAELSSALPKLSIVTNHMANVVIDGGPPPPDWVKGLKAAAAGKHVWCKLSALVEGTQKRQQKAPTNVAFYQPVVDAVWDAFGADRLMFGSNWPVSEHFATLPTVYRLAAEYVKAKGEGAVAKVFGENAKAAYRLKRE